MINKNDSHVTQITNTILYIKSKLQHTLETMKDKNTCFHHFLAILTRGLTSAIRQEKINEEYGLGNKKWNSKRSNFPC